MLQTPVPKTGVIAAKLVEVAHRLWSGPALARDGFAVKVITTSSVEAAQGAFAIVQRRVYTVPATPVNAEVGDVGVVTVPPTPETMLQLPTPTVGVFAAKVTEVPQMF